MVKDANEPEEARATTLPIRPKQQRQQLTKGMEHMRPYVTIEPHPPPSQEGNTTYGVPATIAPLRHTSPKSTPQISADNPEKRTHPFEFGTRYLHDSDDIFSHNAWDHVDVDSEYDSFIAAQTQFQRENAVSEFDAARFNNHPEKWWDRFYSNNGNNFFKDRKWLVQEFPMLGEVTREGYGECTVLEVGAGAGNTAFPLLEMNRNEELRLLACDYSAKAIDVIRSQEAYTAQQEPRVLEAQVWDVADADPAKLPLPAGSLDIVIMIFIFSALAPTQWNQAVHNISTLLKPGGVVLFRDYGRGDLAQVRFKKGRWLEENFYVRGDGTRVYFFEEEELRRVWGGDGDEVGGGESGFVVERLGTDRRLLVNRQRRLKMYRCWMQGLFRKVGEVEGDGS